MATVLTSYTLVPELQHWYFEFLVEKSIVAKDRIPPPTDIGELYMPDNSFIEMLFNNNYCSDTYEYRYIQENRRRIFGSLGPRAPYWRHCQPS